MAKKILALSFLLIPLILDAQNVRDSTVSLHMFSFHASGHIPSGDFAKRYGPTAGAGGSYWFKTRKNWLFSADFTFLFGNTFKQGYIFKDMLDESGNFITNYGEQMYPTVSERGFYTGLRAGKVFPVIGPNPNSGLMLTASAGLLEYKSFFRLEENTVPILLHEYTKLYDYLTNGFAINEFIGYLHLDSDQPINFYAGLEFHQGWTKCRRDWLYDLHGPDNTLRHDFFWGIRVGWIFPVGKKTSGTYTYF
jgi:hypothetical protein